MNSYLFESTMAQHPATLLNIHNFEELRTLKMFFLLFLARKHHHTA